MLYSVSEFGKGSSLVHPAPALCDGGMASIICDVVRFQASLRIDTPGWSLIRGSDPTHQSNSTSACFNTSDTSSGSGTACWVPSTAWISSLRLGPGRDLLAVDDVLVASACLLTSMSGDVFLVLEDAESDPAVLNLILLVFRSTWTLLKVWIPSLATLHQM